MSTWCETDALGRAQIEMWPTDWMGRDGLTHARMHSELHSYDCGRLLQCEDVNKVWFRRRAAAVATAWLRSGTEHQVREVGAEQGSVVFNEFAALVCAHVGFFFFFSPHCVCEEGGKSSRFGSPSEGLVTGAQARPQLATQPTIAACSSSAQERSASTLIPF